MRNLVASVVLAVFAVTSITRADDAAPLARDPQSDAPVSETHALDDLWRQVQLQNLQIAELQQKLEAERKPAETKAARAFDLKFGYDNGFFAASPDGVKLGDAGLPFLMKVNSRLQLRHTLFDSHGTNADANEIEFERLRLIFSGHAYTPDLKYFVQIDGDSDQAEVADWLDYYVDYDFGHHQLGEESGAFGIRLGKWKLPFNRTRAESGFQLQFADRSMASSMFDINRSIGGGLFGKCDVHGKPLTWEAAVFNGFQTQGYIPGRLAQLDGNLATSARVTMDLTGDWGNDGEPDLHPHAEPAVRIGSGFACSRVDSEGQREFSAFRVVDSGDTLDSLLPASVSAYNAFLYAVDANFKWKGFSLLSECYFRQFNQFSGGSVPGLFDHGFLVQSGYFIYPEKLELISRWSRIVGNSGTLGTQNQSADEVAGGIVWYINGHNVKLSCDATHVNGAPVQDSALNLLPGDNGMLYRTQFQLTF